MRKVTVRKRIYQILEKAQPGDIASRVVDLTILALIVLNVVSLMLETIPSLVDRWGRFFDQLNLVSVIIFSVEYLMRIWVSVEKEGPGRPAVKRLRYVFSIMALVDLAAILPFFLQVLPMNTLFVRSFRLMRVFRIFKIGRYSNSIGTMIRVFRKKKDDLLIALFVIAILLIFFANLMYHVENAAQPGVFSSAFQAMWWGAVTITGVGYGDMYPITVLGKVLGGIIAILGVVTIAIPIGILGSAYVEDATSTRLGRIKTVRSTDHIIICGYNGITNGVIQDLLSEISISRVVLVTQRPNPEIPGIVYVNADWTDIEVLKRLSIADARAFIIMAEGFSGKATESDPDMTDMRTLFTLYKVKREFPDVHTVVEVNDPAHLEMVRANLLADEIVLKEVIDGSLTASCIKIPGVSRLIYELINLEGKVLHETDAGSLGLDEPCIWGDVVRHGIENELTFLGFIRGDQKLSQLSPGRDTRISTSDRLIYAADKERR
jgi:voltage-gated potassium channel